MLGCSYLADGNPYATGNIMSVSGQNGTFTQGMDFDYLYQQPPDNYIDVIGSAGGTLIFRSQDNNGRTVFYSGPSGSYRSIHATYIFGALRDGASSKQDLMTQYMSYLTELIGVEEHSDMAIDNISVFPNPFRDQIHLSFSLKQPTMLRISIYNTAGQLVKTIANTNLDKGVHQFTWHGNDNLNREMSNGTYIFMIDDGKTVSQKTVVLLK